MAVFNQKFNEFSYKKYKFGLQWKQSNCVANLLKTHEKCEIRRNFLTDKNPVTSKS